MWLGLKPLEWHLVDGLLSPPSLPDDYFMLPTALSTTATNDKENQIDKPMSMIKDTQFHTESPTKTAKDDGGFMDPENKKPHHRHHHDHHHHHHSNQPQKQQQQQPPHPPILSEHELLIARRFRKLGAILAFGIGYRTILNFFTVLPRSIWHGALSTQLHTHLLADGWLPAPKYPLKTTLGRIVGIFVGGIVGLRSIVQLPGVVLKSFWFGARPHIFHMKDGMLPTPPQEPLYKTLFGRILGHIVGFVIGFRAVLTALTVIPKGMWLGVAPEWFDIPDGILGPTDVGSWQSPAGRLFGIFGGVVGLQLLVNVLSVVFRGAWLGVLPTSHYFKDGVLGPSQSSMVSLFGKLSGLVLGLGVGWRNLTDLVAVSGRSAWYGRWGRLYVDLPKGFKMIKKSTDNLTAVVVKPSIMDLQQAKEEQKEAKEKKELTKKSKSHLALGNLISLPSTTNIKKSPSKLLPIEKPILATAESKLGDDEKDVNIVIKSPAELPPLNIETKLPQHPIHSTSVVEPFPNGTVPAAPKNTPEAQSELPSPSQLVAAQNTNNPFATPTASTTPESPRPLYAPPNSLPPPLDSDSPSSNPFSDPICNTVSPTSIASTQNRPSSLKSLISKDRNSTAKVHPEPATPQPSKRHDRVGYTTVGIDGSQSTLNEDYDQNNNKIKNEKNNTGFSWNVLSSLVKGRPSEDWLQSGASTSTGKISGGILIGLCLAAIVVPISYFFYIGSKEFNSRAATAPTYLLWWYDNPIAAPAILGSIAFLFGLGIGFLGLRNILSPYFYSRTLLPVFLVKLWNPAILPFLEIIAVIIALSIYLPIFSVIVTIRRYLISFNYLFTATFAGCKGGSGSTYTVPLSPRQQKPIRIAGSKFFKSVARILVPAGVFVVLFLTLQEGVFAGPQLGFAAPLIAVAAAIFANPFMDRIFKLVIKSHRSQPMEHDAVAIWQGHGMKSQEIQEVDSLIFAKIKLAQLGKDEGDAAGPLRIWLRDLGFWSDAEIHLKDMQDRFRSASGSLQVVRDIERLLTGAPGLCRLEIDERVYSLHINKEGHFRVLISTKSSGMGLLLPKNDLL
jgi:hypothetical protein